MTKTNKSLMSLLLLSMSGTAFADAGWGVEAWLGEAEQRNRADGYAELMGSENSKGARLQLAINRLAAVEFSYSDFGRAEDSGLDAFGDLITDQLHTTSSQLGLKGRLPLGPKVNALGRLGLAWWQLDYRQTDSAFPGVAFTDSDEGLDGYYGLGLQVHLGPQARLGFNYDVLNFNADIDNISSQQRVENLSVSLGLVF